MSLQKAHSLKEQMESKHRSVCGQSPHRIHRTDYSPEPSVMSRPFIYLYGSAGPKLNLAKVLFIWLNSAGDKTCFLKEEECFTEAGTQDDGGRPARDKAVEERWLWNPMRHRENPSWGLRGPRFQTPNPLRANTGSRTLDEEWTALSKAVSASVKWGSDPFTRYKVVARKEWDKDALPPAKFSVRSRSC